MADLHLVPIHLKVAKWFVADHHRHHAPPEGMLFAVGVADQPGILRGVAITGRPVARYLDNGQTAEVTRLATDGTRNAGSMLYAASWRAASAMGYTRLITYTQLGESGASLRAAGFRTVGERPAHDGWDRPSRPRDDKGSSGMPRTLWEAA
jgi:hypothetical protein